MFGWVRVTGEGWKTKFFHWAETDGGSECFGENAIDLRGRAHDVVDLRMDVLE